VIRVVSPLVLLAIVILANCRGRARGVVPACGLLSLSAALIVLAGVL
jgi:hypothetical protein